MTTFPTCLWEISTLKISSENSGKPFKQKNKTRRPATTSKMPWEVLIENFRNGSSERTDFHNRKKSAIREIFSFFTQTRCQQS